MTCEVCYYRQLCKRAGVGFKALADGSCARRLNYRAEDDGCLSYGNSYKASYLGHEEYDSANLNDEDAQDKTQPRWIETDAPYDDDERESEEDQ